MHLNLRKLLPHRADKKRDAFEAFDRGFGLAVNIADATDELLAPIRALPADERERIDAVLVSCERHARAYLEAIGVAREKLKKGSGRSVTIQATRQGHSFLENGSGEEPFSGKSSTDAEGLATSILRAGVKGAFLR